MKILYKKYAGMLLTFPDDAPKEALASYKSKGIRPEPQKYTKEVFDDLVTQAQKQVTFEREERL